MELKIGKLYNKGMYLGNDVSVDGGELCEPHKNREIFLKDGIIIHNWYEEGEILEDNKDMLPGVIKYEGIDYLLNISTCYSSNFVFRLEYISGNSIFYSSDGESIKELIDNFNEHKESVGYPLEIKYIY